DLAIIALGAPLVAAREAAGQLGEEEISVELINARWLKPLDEELILSAAKRCGRVLTVEEGILSGGFGSAVLELLADNGLQLPVKRIGIPRGIVPHGVREQFLEEFGLSPAAIAASARNLLSV
ncbi:MAG: transketolase C-terminal domain-containing protein, partial [bacterium]